MKKQLLTVGLVAGLSAAVYGQGQITLDNSGNSNPSSTATSGGLVFQQPVLNGATTLFQGNVSITLLAGPAGTAVGSLTPIVTLLGTAGGGTGDGGGQFTDFTASSIRTLPGVPAGSVAELELEMWSGTALTYAVAVTTPGALVDTVVFNNPTGGGIITPPGVTGMPAVILAPAPEPSTIALGGLGAAALLALRRRK